MQTSPSLAEAIVYDIETPCDSVFTLHAEKLYSDVSHTWVISPYQNDMASLLEWFNYLNQNQHFMIGFNNVGFDYPVIHYMMMNPNCSVRDIYNKAMSIINSNDSFGHMVWSQDRFAPQIDMYKINHFDNQAKRTSLKALQINMRSESVVDMPIQLGVDMSQNEINSTLIPYNKHDVSETKKFAHYNKDAIQYRLSLIDQFGIDVLNWSDVKIGTELVIQRIGKEVCYDFTSGSKVKRQSFRHQIVLKDIILPYIKFTNPEFQRILNYVCEQVLRPEEVNIDDPSKSLVKTKGVFTDLFAHVGGLKFKFGTGGLHASLSKTKIVATGDWIIKDIDVSGMYPNIAIASKLAPEHLGERFIEVYKELPKERKEWQATKGKKCVEANTLKLAANGVYGQSNSIFSPLYDPKYTMSVTINGQLSLYMLIERMVEVPTLRLIQANTDGITYLIQKQYEPMVLQIRKEWEILTGMMLEDADYSRMWVRDVNSYVAEDTDGDLKLKGAYWTPDPCKYIESISNSQPSAWHKDFSNVVSIRAAVAHMVHGVDIEQFIRMCQNPYDFMIKVKGSAKIKILHDDVEIQKTNRYYISTDGKRLVKLMPPAGTEGAYKKANGISDAEYNRVMQETGGAWDARVCTKNKSKYETRETKLHASYLTTLCNNVTDFSFYNINFKWYVLEAKKLLV